MSREIKFRAWDAEQEKMIKTFDGNYRILFNEEDGSFFCGGNMSNGDWDEPVLMKYTGLKDKNGQEIYEGDIIKYSLPGGTEEDGETEYVEDVTFVDGCFVTDGTTPLYVAADLCEIIGNIHEQPELLS